MATNNQIDSSEYGMGAYNDANTVEGHVPLTDADYLPRPAPAAFEELPELPNLEDILRSQAEAQNVAAHKARMEALWRGAGANTEQYQICQMLLDQMKTKTVNSEGWVALSDLFDSIVADAHQTGRAGFRNG